jgi:hypothetical protein
MGFLPYIILVVYWRLQISSPKSALTERLPLGREQFGPEACRRVQVEPLIPEGLEAERIFALHLTPRIRPWPHRLRTALQATFECLRHQ